VSLNNQLLKQVQVSVQQINQTSSERVLKIQQVLKESECEFQQVHMAKSIQLLNILDNLILSTT